MKNENENEKMPETLEERVEFLEKMMAKIYLDTSVLTGRIKITNDNTTIKQ